MTTVQQFGFRLIPREREPVGDGGGWWLRQRYQFLHVGSMNWFLWGRGFESCMNIVPGELWLVQVSKALFVIAQFRFAVKVIPGFSLESRVTIHLVRGWREINLAVSHEQKTCINYHVVVLFDLSVTIPAAADLDGFWEKYAVCSVQWEWVMVFWLHWGKGVDDKLIMYSGRGRVIKQ